MASKSLDDLTVDTRQAVEQLLAYAKDEGIDFIVTHTLRTCAEQNALYAQSRTAPGPRVTGAPGCRSWHTHGRAVDLLVKEADGRVVHNGYDPRYAKLGQRAKQLGFRWGGDFGDFGHFEFHPGLSISQACPDPTDCSHLGQPKSTYTPPAAKPPPAESYSQVVLLWAAVGAIGYYFLDKQYRLTERAAAQIGALL